MQNKIYDKEGNALSIGDKVIYQDDHLKKSNIFRYFTLMSDDEGLFFLWGKGYKVTIYPHIKHVKKIF